LFVLDQGWYGTFLRKRFIKKQYVKRSAGDPLEVIADPFGVIAGTLVLIRVGFRVDT
jgi:hypothetical protein